MSVKDNFRVAVHGIASKFEKIRHESEPIAALAVEPAIQPVRSGDAVQKNHVESLATTIRQGSIVNGSIDAESELVVYGKVFGDLSSTSSITVSGQVIGNVLGLSVRLLDAKITGDIKAAKQVFIGGESTLIGNIDSESAEIGGRVKGNVMTSETLVISENAYIAGNITAKSLQVHKNSIIKGNLEIITLDSSLDPFVQV